MLAGREHVDSIPELDFCLAVPLPIGSWGRRELERAGGVARGGREEQLHSLDIVC